MPAPRKQQNRGSDSPGGVAAEARSWETETSPAFSGRSMPSWRDYVSPVEPDRIAGLKSTPGPAYPRGPAVPTGLVV